MKAQSSSTRALGRMPRLLVAAFTAIVLAGCSSAATTAPTAAPTAAPTVAPTTAPTAAPTEAPPSAPTEAPTAAPTGETPKTGGTLVLARDQEGDPNYNPLMTSNNGGIFVDMNIFDQLVEKSTQHSTELSPGLAESWEISPDGLTYTFKLRQGVKFQNGDPVTAEDVKFSIDRAMSPDTDPNMAFVFTAFKSSEIVDPATFRINLSKIDASFLDGLSMWVCSIVPKKVVEALGEEKFGEQPIGSGPFMLKTFTRGQSTELVRNPHYWRTGLPYLDGVTLLTIADNNARVLKVQSGEAQIAAPVPVAQMDVLKGSPGVTLLQEKLIVTWLVMLNVEKEPLGDVKVRQALNYATPKDVLVDVIFKGTAHAANSCIPELNHWDPSIPVIPYDIDKAKELMAQSSVPNGFTLAATYKTGTDEIQQMFTILQAEWAKIGVKLELHPVDPAAASKARVDGDFEASATGPYGYTSEEADDNEHAQYILNGEGDAHASWTRWVDPKAIDLINRANGTLDEAERTKLYSELQAYCMENGPFVPLTVGDQLSAVRDNVKGFSTLPTGWWLLQDVWLSQ
jgi:peptide/nickel transport system substrate-binding protein